MNIVFLLSIVVVCMVVGVMFICLKVVKKFVILKKIIFLLFFMSMGVLMYVFFEF